MPDFVIESIESVTDRIRYFSLRHANGDALPSYDAGAHVQITTVEDTLRAYSLIDFTLPDNPPLSYRIAVQCEPDGQGGSEFMHSLKVGDTVQCTEPENSFSLVDDDRPVLLLAGGIGITPMISMATALHTTAKSFELHYSGRSASTMSFCDTLLQQFNQAVHLYVDDVDDRKLDLNTLFEGCSAQEQLYICGPKGMIDAARAAAEAKGFPADQIHVELFATPSTSPAIDGDDQSFEIEIQSSGQIFVVPKDKTIIDVLEAEGVDAMYDCQRGDCGICQTTVIAGDIDHRDVVLSSVEKARGDVMQICVSRAKSARLVLDL